MTIKICFFCEHCYTESGFAYSELTWESGSVGCSKLHWGLIGDNLNTIDIGQELIRAETCPDFTLHPTIKQTKPPIREKKEKS